MKVGIIGTGTMGIQIALLFAQQENHSIYLCGRNDFIDKCTKNLEKVLNKMYTNNEQDNFQILSRIRLAEKSICSDCDLIIECVTENRDIKKEVFKELYKINQNPHCIFATCSSSIPVSELSDDKMDIIGLHFFNPVNKIDLVEVFIDNNDNYYELAVNHIITELGLMPIIINEKDSISIVNRILIPMINEAINLVYEENIPVERIDNLMGLINRHFQPLLLADMIGLDICLDIMESLLYRSHDNPKYEPSPLLIKMVREGKLGRKTGEGFYKYND